jgi:small subunit ribosomal protein S11
MKISKKITSQKSGIIHIQSTTNNTLISLTDLKGNTQFFVSAGSLGFKNSRKSTVYAAGAAAEALATRALAGGYQNVSVKVKGLGYGKKSAIRGLEKSNLVIKQIVEATPITHNGCRPPKKRRV